MKLNKHLIATVIILLIILVSNSHAQLSHSPRQTGEEILEEILMGSEKFIVSVGSNGCTDKDSFNIDVKKGEGITSKAPHYNLTVMRIRPDECKAIVASGTLVLFDMKKDLGIKGIYSYSITNRVVSPSVVPSADESLMSIIEKHFDLNFRKLK